MTILVTGSGGHLGEALVRQLQTAKREARGLDIEPGPFTHSCGSITDRAFVQAALQGVRAVIHTATLHKPHIATHEPQAFVDTNVSGTLTLLEAATRAKIEAFIFTSTTSAFGGALTPPKGGPAAWITEDVWPIPRNIYGTTKLAAEQLCELFHRQWRLPVIVLRTSRFFPEPDDDPEVRESYELANVQANEMLYRRVDIADVVDAHLLAVAKAAEIGFGRYIVSATTPFTQADAAVLHDEAPAVVERLFPDYARLYRARGWTMFPHIDRVYVNGAASAELGWRPAYDFAHVLSCLRAGKDFRSPLARDIGSKGYHPTRFGDGPYPLH